MRTQFAALCYRVKKGKVQVLLVTSRGTKRWIVPKGWPMDGKTPAQSAALEAWEEGV
ncbi:NUDIX hydrolase [Sulfitobacter aestuariivivens]|uniref:NUDIX hydrolase n=1 Tax=Sulfitobacter aestuariivivens TaxID=2766981 RepID=UPI003616B2D3